MGVRAFTVAAAWLGGFGFWLWWDWMGRRRQGGRIVASPVGNVFAEEFLVCECVFWYLSEGVQKQGVANEMTVCCVCENAG